MNLYCDNYATCKSLILDQGGVAVTVDRARARGWHLYAGPSLTGKRLDVVLCDICVGTTIRRATTPGPLPGQMELEF